ncbi:tRNA lysidine(34) synthetase TilS [Sphingobacterium endophyticum]|uniref:tRNA lysidine(34) synthetase TilS n=1 Tax=Sphingobacterium endophyticum TaxID=2546448 RepID=UPI0012E1FF64|nr:tRNA lysidine(34) synthetase TilS [Sphingobacterium endophyticum]
MPVLERLKQFIIEKNLLTPGDRVLLAVSGGKDSMLMAKFFHDLNVDAIVAHCNFQLRGEESDKDEKLVVEYCEELGFPVLLRKFDTEQFAAKNKISIQMAARQLRYEWFESARVTHNCSVIAIAQHANDHLETVLLNLTRSTGIQGLLGIQPKRGFIIRPLLFLSALEIAQLVDKLKVPYRDDQSNFSTKYARNKIRLEIIPKFKEIQPDFETIILQNIKHFEESQQFIQRQVESIRQSIFQSQDENIIILKDLIRPYLQESYLLFEIFKIYHFQRNVIEDLISVFDQGMGQVFQSQTHELLLSQNDLIIRERAEDRIIDEKIEKLDSKIKLQDKLFSMEEGHEIEFSDDKSKVQVDQDLLKFPLTIRTWNQGDSFKPLGMEGSKKLSDYFIQQKINRFEKNTVPILVNADGIIIWVLGMRLDNRFKVTENTKKVLTLVYK